ALSVVHWGRPGRDALCTQRPGRGTMARRLAAPSAFATLLLACALTFLVAVRPAAAQVPNEPVPSLDTPYTAGTSWTTAFTNEGTCVWRGQEPDGAMVYAYTQQANCAG